MKKLATSLIISTLLVSCSKVKEIDNRTESMSNTTKKMSKTTEQMKESTDTLLKLQRQYSSADLRSKQISSLYNKETDMGDKLIAAKKLMLSFEYQLWNPTNSFDTAGYRDELITDAVREFFYKAGGIHSELMETNIWGKTKIEKMSPLKIEKQKRGINSFNNEMIFYALATNLHANNILQQQGISNVKEGNLRVLSLLDIIENALIKDFESASLSDAEEIVVTGKFKTVAIELLKARFNFLITLAIKNLVDDQDISIGNKANAMLFKLSNGLMGKIKLDSIFDSSNIATQQDINQKLEAAINTRRTLNTIGQEVVLDKSLSSILRNLQIIESETVTKEASQFLTYIDILSSEY